METKQIVLGGGCFWCLEAFFQLFKGVIDVSPGYAGGTSQDPIYEKVCNGIGGHAEVVQLTYYPEVLPLTTILEVFWAVHNPTTVDQQGNDHGPQYRSAIYYSDDSELEVINQELEKAQQNWEAPIVTEIKLLDTFYPAESYHKNYFINNPAQAYCQVVINPKLSKIKQKFDTLMV